MGSGPVGVDGYTKLSENLLESIFIVDQEVVIEVHDGPEGVDS